MHKFKEGEMVRYIGPDLVTYEKGKTYKVEGYDEELQMYGVMSELDEAYLLDEKVLEKIEEKTKHQ